MSPTLDLSQIAGVVAEQARSSEPLHWNLGEYLNHWSPSSLSMLRRCPYQWQQRYIKGIKSRPGEAPVTGTAVHAALERNFGQKIDSHEDLPAAELLEWFDDVGWPTVLDLEQAKSGFDVQWDSGSGPDRAHGRGRKMLSQYHGLVAPRIQPTSVEGEFSTDEFGLSVPVIGRFDITREDSVIDVKTGKRKYTVAKEDWRMQGGVYAFVKDRPVEFHSVSITDAGNVSVITPLEAEGLLVHPSYEERRQMVFRVRAISAEACLYMELFGPEIDWPTHGVDHSWACSYCGYRPDCPAWKHE